MGIFRRIKKHRIELEAVDAAATRAIFQANRGELAHLEFTFKIKNGREIHEVVVDMTHHEASKFLQQAVNVHAIIAPPIRPGRTGPISN